MAAGSEVSPKRLSESCCDDRIVTKPVSLLRRNSRVVGNGYYYSSFDNSVSACSIGDTMPMLASSTPPPADYLEESSDHEREDDRESTYLVRCGSHGKLGSSIQAQDVVGAEDEQDQDEGNCDSIRPCKKEVIIGKDVVSPYTLTCTLIPSWTVKNCKFVSCLLLLIVTQ